MIIRFFTFIIFVFAISLGPSHGLEINDKNIKTEMRKFLENFPQYMMHIESIPESPLYNDLRKTAQQFEKHEDKFNVYGPEIQCKKDSPTSLKDCRDSIIADLTWKMRTTELLNKAVKDMIVILETMARAKA